MRLIKKNPYRVIGLLAGATAKEQDRQIKRLKQYLAAEQEPEGDYSFPSLGQLDRTLEDVTDASSKLTLDNDKMTAALFWFYNGNSITDEPAFDLLKDGNIEECTEIWLKLTASGEVTKRNSSAYHNLSTLLLRNSFISSGIDEKILAEAIAYKIEFLESDSIKDFIAHTTDETFKTNKEQLQLIFLRLLHAEVERHGGINTIKFLEIINNCEFTAKEEFIREFINKPIEQIERKITDTRSSRKENKNDAIKIGTALFNQTKESLSLLKSVLGSKSIKYISISDKVSEEILQCGIDYFKLYKDTQNDPSQAVMNLLKTANSLACGNIAKQRCTENIDNLQEWISDKPERDKQFRIKADLDKLIALFQEFDNRNETIENAKSIINRSKPHLTAIKSVLGSSDELYLKLSTRVAMQAQSYIIEEVNKAQENLDYKLALDRYGTISRLKSTLSNAWAVTTLLGTLDMEYAFKSNRYNPNKDSLRGLCVQLGVSTSTYSTPSTSSSTNRTTTSSSTSSSSSSSGCYIATMAYGSYDHPQVLVLRQFRDEILDKSTFGKWFIKTYYHYSPMLVERLKDHRKTNILIRKLLNQIIKLIKP